MTEFHYFLDADREYQRIAAYKKSPEFEKKQNTIDKHEKMIEAKKSNGDLTKDENLSLGILKRSIEVDRIDIQSTNVEYDLYLRLAVENYIKFLSLESSDESNQLMVFRLFSLLFSNQANTTILSEIRRYYDEIATHKFIPVMTQITTHLSNNNNELSQIIESIIRKFVNIN